MNADTLLVDIGNTTVAWRPISAGRWVGEPTRAPAAEAPQALVADARRLGIRSVAAVASAPAMVSAIETALAAHGIALAIAERDFPIPIETTYYDRREIGRDRLCNALAARESLGAPCVSCSVGTCITVEAISADGVLIGGAIAAGIPALRAGIEDTASHLAEPLAQAAQAPPPTLDPGRSTTENLRLGLWLQAASTVERLVDMARRAVARSGEHEAPDIPVALTGGDSAAIASLCGEHFRVEEFLTLEGLRLAYLGRTQ